MSDAAWGGHWAKPSTGMAEKPDDRWAVPLCRPRYRPDPVAHILKPDKPLKLQHVGCHGLQHGHSIRKIRELMHDDDTGMKLEEAFWRSTGKNPFMIAAVLYEKVGTVKDAQPPRQRKPRAKPKRSPEVNRPKQKIPSRPFAKTQRKIPTRKKHDL